MAGIYIHIPFCKQSCHYCDFHFSTTFEGYRTRLIKAICGEISLQKNFLNESVETIYFGGGTPSTLHGSEIKKILDVIREQFDTKNTQEITLEANPDDLTSSYLKELANIGINRLSIGIQSFHDEDLVYMNRAHNAQQAMQCIQLAQDEGITNISIDLIYGYPLLSDEKWKHNLLKATSLGVQHISSYAMTVEPGTALNSFISKGKVSPINDEQSAEQFQFLLKVMLDKGYEHYEISNFCLPTFESKHNSSYWLQKNYLGIGPSAHSYNGANRFWNISNNMKYLLSIEQGKVPNTEEIIDEKTAYNEYILTRLRTKWGVEEKLIRSFSIDIQKQFFEGIGAHISANSLTLENGIYSLTAKGKLLADGIASDLFVV